MDHIDGRLTTFHMTKSSSYRKFRCGQNFYQFGPLAGRIYGSNMSTIMNRFFRAMQTLARVSAALALLAIALFCAFGFLAAFEPGNGWFWKLGYGALGCLCVTAAVGLLRRRGGSRKPPGAESSPGTPRAKRS